MKRKRPTPEQVIRKLPETDAELSAGKGIVEVCQKLEVSEATFHRWRFQYGGMKADDARQLKELQDENKRLKKLVADLKSDELILEATTQGKLERQCARELLHTLSVGGSASEPEWNP